MVGLPAIAEALLELALITADLVGVEQLATAARLAVVDSPDT
jgi:hypothetical protein